MSEYLSETIDVNINKAAPLEIVVDNSQEITELEVEVMNAALLDVNIPMFYIKSGQQEIKNYVDNVSKPDINQYISDYAEPIVAKVVNKQAETLVNTYVESVTKPSIDEYVATDIEPKLQEYVDAAAISATAAETSAALANVSAMGAADSASFAADTLAQVGTEVDAGIAQFNANALAKQSLVDVAADAAEESAMAAESSANRSENEANRSEAQANRASSEASKAVGLEIGSLVSATLPILNAVKYLFADGSQYSRTGAYQGFADYLAQVKLTHPYLFITEAQYQEAIAKPSGQCGYYVLEPTFFRVPRITRYIGATINLADMGKAWEESLPQHKHTVNLEIAPQQGRGSSQPLVASYQENIKTTSEADNPIYQDGAKVNPERITYPYYIVVSNAGQMTPVEIDINNVLNDLALKMDKDGRLSSSSALHNIASVSDATGKSTIAGLSVPDTSRAFTVTMPFTAPRVGWFIAHGNNINVTVYLNGVSIAQGNWSSNSWSGNENCQILIDQGDVITGAASVMRFIPCKGVI